MKTVSQFISEALITFGKSAYPKFGNIVILAGGTQVLVRDFKRITYLALKVQILMLMPLKNSLRVLLSSLSVLSQKLAVI